MSTDPSLWSFIADASLVVKCVILILMIASVISWTIIFQRMSLLKKCRRLAEDFEHRFWSGIDLNQLYNDLTSREDHQASGLSGIFVAGFKEFKKSYQKTHIDSNNAIQNIERSMRISTTRELETLDQPISFLATVGSTSPYVGLFGTVWGIMTSFQALGHAQQATLAMVAPGISEALIATAIGLFAAIPAVVGYNRLNHKMDQIASQYETFQEEFTTILMHQLEGKRG